MKQLLVSLLIATAVVTGATEWVSTIVKNRSPTSAAAASNQIAGSEETTRHDGCLARCKRPARSTSEGLPNRHPAAGGTGRLTVAPVAAQVDS
jgi:hypothetical protein